MIRRVTNWLWTNRAARTGGLFLVGVPAYFLWTDSRATAVLVGGAVGWAIGSAALARSDSRRGVALGAAVGFAATYAVVSSAIVALTVFDHPAAGRAWRDLPRGLFIDAPVVAGFVGYGGAFLGWLLCLVRRSLAQVRLAQLQRARPPEDHRA